MRIAQVLAVIGAINWGLIGLFRFDLVAAIFGPMSFASRVVYSLVGLAGLVAAGWIFAPERDRGRVRD